VARLKEMVKAADAVVVTAMPVGIGNIANLTALIGCNVPVYIVGEFEDYTGGAAKEARRKILADGGICTADSMSLIKKLLPLEQ
ncbi:MAG TPA: ABC transporter ATP-binding protein, partial [Methanocorpusculum sp.]|nr:ABC transporter ATP-binding protein [Methanocorpusculum sp.]